jgi:ABC-type transporter Mla MlaB component
MTTWPLPAELTIYTAADLHGRWLAELRDGAAPRAGDDAEDTLAVVDAAAVEQVDGAGLQLLVSLIRTLADRGLAVRVDRPSAVLCAAAAALGLDAHLNGATA